MFGIPRHLERIAAALEGLQTLYTASTTVATRQQQHDDRIALLERTMANTLANAEALMTRADSKNRAANSAAERARRLAKLAEDPDEELGDEHFAEAVRAEDGNRSSRTAMPAMYSGMENGAGEVGPTAEQVARAMKWQRR